MEILKKLRKKQELTGDEVYYIVSGQCYPDIEIIEEQRTGSGRWQEYWDTIFKAENNYYCIYWSKGLTELQEDYYDEQCAIKVKPIKKLIEITEWELVKEEEN